MVCGRVLVYWTKSQGQQLHLGKLSPEVGTESGLDCSELNHPGLLESLNCAVVESQCLKRKEILIIEWKQQTGREGWSMNRWKHAKGQWVIRQSTNWCFSSIAPRSKPASIMSKAVNGIVLYMGPPTSKIDLRTNLTVEWKKNVFERMVVVCFHPFPTEYPLSPPKLTEGEVGPFFLGNLTPMIEKIRGYFCC